MKKIKFTGKLSLNKETVAKLNAEQMGSVNGGSLTLHCTTTCSQPGSDTITTCPGPSANCSNSCFGSC